LGDGACRSGQATGEEGTVWTVPPSNELEWRELNDEFLVYNSASGQTHHLNFLAGEALRSLEDEAARAHELVRRLADQFEIAEDTPSLQTIDQLIREFDELGLIAPLTS
jgi:PqqD family protein of HPr-rel-A system